MLSVLAVPRADTQRYVTPRSHVSIWGEIHEPLVILVSEPYPHRKPMTWLSDHH
jgi:hypothetical protein